MKKYVAISRDPPPMMMRTTCVIFGNTVTTLCLGMGAPGAPAAAGGASPNMCRLNMAVDFTPIPLQHLSISELLRSELFDFFVHLRFKAKI
ncbi:hypothetical protein KIN20_007308 [Parelaphostrongylus tenuis]|uniref:Uncharacterized protein n=1 Tax=Parelaphostrongylus tenuis TaxID=148309 RepID=A0AAD5MM09_PARTN|nr:hypothetical protein KIN20_007308 [Parelaphostrongylus tenuis]